MSQLKLSGDASGTGIVTVAAPNTNNTYTVTLPAAAGTLARTDAAQTFTGVQTFSSDASINGLTVGRGAGAVSTNTAVGASALAANTTGSENTATGAGALVANLGGAQNAAFGRYALPNNTSGSANSAFGYGAMLSNLSGGSNTAFGYATLYSNTTASNNTAVGYQALYASNRTADANGYNTAIGYGSGSAITTGQKNTIIGAYTGNQGGTTVPTLDIRTSSTNVVLSDGNGAPLAVINGQESALKSKAFASLVTLGGNRVAVNYDIYIPNEGQTAGAGFLVWASTIVDSQSTYTCYSLAAIQCSSNATNITTAVIASGGSNGTISFSCLAGVSGVVILRVSFNKSASSGSGNYTSTDSITIIGA